VGATRMTRSRNKPDPGGRTPIERANSLQRGASVLTGIRSRATLKPYTTRPYTPRASIDLR
jgi:hypothetical protein